MKKENIYTNPHIKIQLLSSYYFSHFFDHILFFRIASVLSILYIYEHKLLNGMYS